MFYNCHYIPCCYYWLTHKSLSIFNVKYCLTIWKDSATNVASLLKKSKLQSCEQEKILLKFQNIQRKLSKSYKKCDNTVSRRDVDEVKTVSLLWMDWSVIFDCCCDIKKCQGYNYCSAIPQPSQTDQFWCRNSFISKDSGHSIVVGSILKL